MLDGWRICSIGAYFAYLEHPWPERSGSEVAEWLARERGVLALPGSFFGPGQERLLRVAFANVDVAALRSLPERLAMDRRKPLSPRRPGLDPGSVPGQFRSGLEPTWTIETNLKRLREKYG